MKRLLLIAFLINGTLSLVAQVPANDNCADAITVSAGEVITFNTTESTTDGPFHLDCPSADNDSIFRDIWYVFTPDFTGMADWSLCGTADYDTKIAIYNPGTVCPAQDADLLTCNDDFGNCAGSTSRIIWGVTAGETYLLRLGGWGATAPGEAGQGSFIIEEFVSQVTNDFCDFAEVVMLGEDQQFSNTGATTDGPDHPNDPGCFGFGDISVQADIWYTFTSPITGAVEWSTCDQITFDSRLAVYQAGATCPVEDDDLIACNDDGSGCTGFTSRLIFDVEEGETYLLRLGGFGGDQGSGMFDLVSTIPPEPPANDLCMNSDSAWIVTAYDADNFTGAIEGTTTNGTFEPNDFLFPNTQCFNFNTTSGEFSTVWYHFNTYGNEELEFRLFKEADSDNASFLLEMFELCDQQVDTMVLMGSCLAVGETDDFAVTTVTGLPAEPTDYLLRISTRLTSQLPGDFFFFVVGAITEPPSATYEAFPGDYSVFPNPAGDRLYLNLSLAQHAETDFSIMNSLGQQVLSQDKGNLSAGTHRFDMNITGLDPGVYFLVLRSDKGTSMVKFVKS